MKPRAIDGLPVGVGLQKAWVLSLVLAMLVFPSGMRAKAKAEGMVARARDTVYRDYRCFYSWESLKKTTLGMGLAGVVANTSMDGEIQGWVQESLRDEDTDELSESVKPFGEGAITIPLYAGAALLGKLTEGNQRDSFTGEWGRRSLRAIVVGAPPMLFLQKGIGASRPKEDDSRWRPFNDNNGVSGHSFMGAVPFLSAATMTENRYVKYSLFLGSMLCGFSRINDNCHYFSQAALGWWTAYVAASCAERRENGEGQALICPRPVAGGIGIMAVISF
ncbi:MAG: phosphatase PAP2 family protein [Deltaproteobacteria bacterium]|nr:phosphatase PAP2 family protein [Deltaproteobacteria bacterium]